MQVCALLAKVKIFGEKKVPRNTIILFSVFSFRRNTMQASGYSFVALFTVQNAILIVRVSEVKENDEKFVESNLRVT